MTQNFNVISSSLSRHIGIAIMDALVFPSCHCCNQFIHVNSVTTAVTTRLLKTSKRIICNNTSNELHNKTNQVSECLDSKFLTQFADCEL